MHLDVTNPDGPANLHKRNFKRMLVSFAMALNATMRRNVICGRRHQINETL